MRLNEIRDNTNAKHSKKRVGRGPGSGTGKTGAFTVGTLNIIDTSKKQTQAIIMAPTRELAMQISCVFNDDELLIASSASPSPSPSPPPPS